ncbi:hypothetical protein J2Y45_004017 [Dyadobacter sp. BE34]|uniref:Uncharacterized protein n=1 Tax=Dyadobacter fermentans TaxID=94254 RepID=A0ABU1R1I1_9BACT|nr:hypothetical protein [Dyadobacter fermentans]MDR7044567.1 hypothetical protein [Dyadobacter sp. BE242]MDR7198877.1 hypothetical protein [Dyadobacter sp. BE34]MDR7216839.1 hypothetical protein [Dyadobacter sp. BE31]MDR7263635.1 hypothetical protein [Dyadobacter sp. BE32]
MQMPVNNEKFPDFPYRASEVVRFIQSKELFTCMLSNGRVIHFCPGDVASFRRWLVGNGVKDISEVS